MQVQKRTSPATVILLFSGLILLGCFLLLGLPEDQRSPSRDKSYVLLSFDDFDNLTGGKDRLEGAHRMVIFQQYRGKYVRWTGEVYEAETNISGNLILKVRHRASTNDFDVAVRLGASQAEKLKRLNRGEAVSYSGKLISFDPDVGYYLEDGEID